MATWGEADKLTVTLGSGTVTTVAAAVVAGVPGSGTIAGVTVTPDKLMDAAGEGAEMLLSAFTGEGRVEAAAATTGEL